MNVASCSKKETHTQNIGEVSTTLEYNWHAPSTLSQSKEAVFNFISLNFMLYPFDPSGINLRILNKYDWISTARDEKSRVELISLFFNLCQKKMAHAAVN